MGFRTRLLLGLGLAVLLTAGVQALLGYRLYKSWLDHSADGYVDRFLRTLSPGVDLAGERPEFDESRLATPPSDWSWIRYRLSRAGQTLLAGPAQERFPADDAMWTTGQTDLGEGYLFDVALNLEEIRQSLSDYRRTTITALLFSLLLTLAFITLLFRFSMQPITRLTEATRALSSQRFPDPVKPPPGNDEVTELARSFNDMTEAIRGFLERERSFTRYASHELRTPLSAAHAQVEALELGLLPAPSVIAALKETLQRMERIQTGLLVLARSAALGGERLPVAEIVADVTGSLAEPERTRIVHSDGYAGLSVLGQRELVTQALGNLIDNALKYSAGPITLTAVPRQERIGLVVADRGGGAPPELIDRLPEPFFQAGSRRDGVGLGLALVLHIARSLGGGLQLRNTESGFEAELTLPRGH